MFLDTFSGLLGWRMLLESSLAARWREAAGGGELALANRFASPPKKSVRCQENELGESGFLASCSRVETACGVVSTGEGREKKFICVCISLSGNFLAATAEEGRGPRFLFIFLAGSHSEISDRE